MTDTGTPGSHVQPDVTVVIPVYNGEAFIAESIATIVTILDEAPFTYDLVVVSDGSVDGTFAEIHGTTGRSIEVIHYEQNAGKGYAVKVGMLAATGRYVAFLDADLDLHPGRLAEFYELAERHGHDAVIGSKRHQDSNVDYPRRRRIYSAMYQRLIAVLFGVNVRDTQVGIKLFRSELAAAVAPRLLVKRYAFDLELLVAARQLGYTDVIEAPITLTYQFSGSGMNVRAVAQALWDTAAIWYRARIKRTYTRVVVPRVRAWSAEFAPRSIDLFVVGPGNVATTVQAVEGLRTPLVVRVANADAPLADSDGPARETALLTSDADLAAFIPSGSSPSTNWATSAAQLFTDESIVAVAGPTVPRPGGGARSVASAALYASRVGVGGVRHRHEPGIRRENGIASHRNTVMRRTVALQVEEAFRADPTMHRGDLATELSHHGRVMYAPDAHLTIDVPPLFAPLLRQVHRHGVSRGRRMRSAHTLPRQQRIALLALLVLLVAAGAWIVGSSLGAWSTLALLGLYVAAVLGSVIHAAFARPWRAALLLGPAIPLAHAAHILGVVRGFATPGTSQPRKGSA